MTPDPELRPQDLSTERVRKRRVCRAAAANSRTKGQESPWEVTIVGYVQLWTSGLAVGDARTEGRRKAAGRGGRGADCPWADHPPDGRTREQKRDSPRRKPGRLREVQRHRRNKIRGEQRHHYQTPGLEYLTGTPLPVAELRFLRTRTDPLGDWTWSASSRSPSVFGVLSEGGRRGSHAESLVKAQAWVAARRRRRWPAAARRPSPTSDMLAGSGTRWLSASRSNGA